ncbi:MAG: Stf0 family sulfotransferase [Bacteroidota bacterium]
MRQSYTLWFSQRNGSSVLAQALCDTGIAGLPGEHFLTDRPLRKHFQVASGPALLEAVEAIASTSNGVIAFKQNAISPTFRQNLLAGFEGVPGIHQNLSSLDIWETLFPHHQHIFLTRRNKVRQVVSWWKAIQTQEWHRKTGSQRPYSPDDIRDNYDPDALHHLLKEVIAREAALQEMLSSRNRTALSLVYEDFVQDFPATVKRILTHLNLDHHAYDLPKASLAPLADELSEEWVARFRKDLQKGWGNIAW